MSDKKIGCIGHDCGKCSLPSPDKNVEKNREMLLQRSLLGVAKYGCTTEGIPSLRDCLQHALEEALDMANYLQAAITNIDKYKDDGK